MIVNRDFPSAAQRSIKIDQLQRDLTIRDRKLVLLFGQRSFEKEHSGKIDGAVFAGLRSLESRGFVTRSRDHYRLTRRGRDELAMACAIARLVARTECAA